MFVQKTPQAMRLDQRAIGGSGLGWSIAPEAFFMVCLAEEGHVGVAIGPSRS